MAYQSYSQYIYVEEVDDIEIGSLDSYSYSYNKFSMYTQHNRTFLSAHHCDYSYNLVNLYYFWETTTPTERSFTVTKSAHILF